MAKSPPSSHDRRYAEDMRLGWKLLGVAFQLGAEVGAATLIGYGADWYFATFPRWTSVGAIGGIVVGLFNFVRSAVRLQGGWSGAGRQTSSPSPPARQPDSTARPAPGSDRPDGADRQP